MREFFFFAWLVLLCVVFLFVVAVAIHGLFYDVQKKPPVDAGPREG